MVVTEQQVSLDTSVRRCSVLPKPNLARVGHCRMVTVLAPSAGVLVASKLLQILNHDAALPG